MTGESQNWVSAADSIFASFGDVVKNVVVKSVSPGAFDREKGGYSESVTSINTKAVPVRMSRDFMIKKGALVGEFDSYLVRGSDFDDPPNVGDILVVDSVDHRIDEVEPDSAQVGAYFKLFVKRK